MAQIDGARSPSQAAPNDGRVFPAKAKGSRPTYFGDKYSVDVLDRFSGALTSLRDDGYLMTADPDQIALTREGLLRVDSLLPRFFLPEHTNLRYT